MNINEQSVIEKLTLRLGGKQIELTVEEAKKLHAALNEMFERKVIVEERHVHNDYPRWTWGYPWTTITYTPTTIPNSTPDPKLPYTVWCSSENQGTMAVYKASGHSLELST